MASDTKKCPYCGEDIKINAKKCKHCGEWLAEKENNNYEAIGNIISVGLVIIGIILFISYSSFDLKCDSSDVMDLAINTFKESSLYYQSLSPNQISSVVLNNPVEISHDDSISKYFCKGTIVINFTQGNDYRCNVEYTAEQKNDILYVETTNCNDSYLYMKLNPLFNALQYNYDE